MKTLKQWACLWAGVMVVLAGVVAAHAGILVCPGCAYEVPEGARFCGHCGQLARPDVPDESMPAGEGAVTGFVGEASSAVPASALPAVVAQPLSSMPTQTLSFLDPEIVNLEVRRGNDCFREERPELARLFYKNALYLEQLVDPRTVDASRQEKLLGYVKRCDTSERRVRAQCTTCGGSGKRMVSVPSLNGAGRQREAPGIACSSCGGKGYTFSAASRTDRDLARGKAMQDYITEQKGRGYVQSGAVWLPAEADARLTLEQKVALKRASAAPCSACKGDGFVPCARCQGLGVEKCGKCKDGWERVDTKFGLTSSTMQTKRKCAACGGSGNVTCRDCGGACRSLCTRCNGSGERALCAVCEGKGLLRCSTCNGTGRYGTLVCPRCYGRGVSLCGRCGGEGRRDE